MASNPRPSFPSVSTEPGIRRLGLRPSGTNERPIRPQYVVLLLAAVVVLVLPLYFLRKPAAVEEEDAPVASGFSPSVPVGSATPKKKERVSLGAPQRVRCGASVASTAGEGSLCDAQPVFEDALAKAIRESVDCAPMNGSGSINFVLRVDFGKKTLHVFPGQSGVWRGPQARRATKCAKQALAAPEWEKIAHRYAVYEIAILANYEPPAASEAPLFE